MDDLLAIAAAHDIAVVEDAAHGIGAAYKGRPLGSIGLMGCYSFHGTKNIVSGEGGALLLNRGQQQLTERAEIIYEKGTNRSQFMRGEVDRYTWQGIGSSFIMADLLRLFYMPNWKDWRKSPGSTAALRHLSASLSAIPAAGKATASLCA